MFKLLRPNLKLSRIDELDLDLLASKGIKAMIIDIDNTITQHNRMECEGWAHDFIAGAKQKGFKLCLLSNNGHKRVMPIARELDIPGIPEAGKPRDIAYLKAKKAMGTGPKNTAAIGDQLFTDILGGNRAGIFTVLVKPLGPHEELRVKLIRPLEKAVKLIMR